MNIAESTSGRPRREYVFSDFSLDPMRGVLRRGNEVVELRSKSFEVLVYLIERQGELVTREELMQAIWPDVDVTDESITRCISDIRKALGDEPPQIIRTVPRRGYLFAAPITTPVFEFPSSPPQPVHKDVALPSQSSQRGVRWRIAISLGVIATLLLGLFGWRSWRGRNSDTNPPAAIPLISLPGLARYPSFSPDGNYIVFSWTGPRQDNPDLYIQQVGAGAPLRLTTDPANDYNPVWSPDGHWIAFLRRHAENADISDLILIPPLGGPERLVKQIHVWDTYFVIPPYLTWCPDSSCVVVSQSPADNEPAALVELSLDTGAERDLTHPPSGSTGDTNPSISSDGRWLVFRRAINSRAGALYRLALGSSTASAERLTSPAMDAGYPSWLPGSKDILFSAEGSELRGTLWRLAVADSAPDSTAPTRLPYVGEDGIMPAFSRAPGQPSRLAYVRTFQDSNIWGLRVSSPGSPAAGPASVAIASSRRDSTPQFSHDGRRVAFASDRSGSWEIWAADPDGSNAVRLTFFGASPNSGGAAGAPGWSPSGDSLVFQANPDGQPEVFRISANGGKPHVLTSSGTRPTFSPNGEWVYFTSNRSGSRQIWKIPAAGGAAIQVTSNGAFAGFASPDGRYLYYNQSMDTPSPVWRIPTSGGVPAKIAEGVVLGAFALTGDGMYYIDRPAGGAAVLYIDRPTGESRLRYLDFATNKTQTVARNLGNTYLGLTVSPDGGTILFSRVDSSLDDLMLVERFP